MNEQKKNYIIYVYRKRERCCNIFMSRTLSKGNNKNKSGRKKIHDGNQHQMVDK